MLTLHKATEETKTLIKWGTISIGLILFLIVLIRTAINLKEHFFPTPPPPPTVSFGKLPPIPFPKNAIDDTFTYSLDTLSGALPTFSDRLTVYKTASLEPNLLALDRAIDRVSKAGFTKQPLPLSETLYQWEDQTSLKRTLTYNILSSNFSLTSDYLTQATPSAKNTANEQMAIDKATSFLSNIASFPIDLDTQKTTAQLLTITNGVLTPATSLSNAKIFRVDFFQKDVEQLPIFYPFPPYSVMNMLFENGEFNQLQLIEAHFYHQSISNISATYPIKTAGEAFLELKNQKAYIASYFGSSKNIRIHDVLIGYLFLDQQQDFLMPIIVFEGNNGFYAYVSAVRENWISK